MEMAKQMSLSSESIKMLEEIHAKNEGKHVANKFCIKQKCKENSIAWQGVKQLIRKVSH